MSDGKHGHLQDLLAEANRASVIDAATWAALKRVFSQREFGQWTDGLARLLARKIGYSAILDFARASVQAARRYGPAAGLRLEASARAVQDKAGERAAAAMFAATAHACRHLAEAEDFAAWLATMEELAEGAPESVAVLCDHLGYVLQRLDAREFHSWVHAGIRGAGRDPAARLEYFDLKDQSAIRAFEQASSDVLFSAVQARAAALVGALWRFHPIMRTLAVTPGRPAPRRSAFDGAVLWVPEAYAGRHGSDAVLHYKAAIAHIGAHAAYGGGRFPRGKLKPIQIALVSLIEDARVENLAIADYPGLRRLWLRYHTAQPGKALAAELLMLRLSRALVDPDYLDDDPWITKARAMFFDSRDNWTDPEISRTIGGLLGNDLGQMRIQFNAKTYVVEPSYRDDNSGLWEIDDEPPPAESEAADVMLNAAQIEQKESDEPKSRHETSPEAPPANVASRASPLPEDEGFPIARHPEWDYRHGGLRPEWTTLNEYNARPAPAAAGSALLQRHEAALVKIRNLVKSAKISRPQWRSRQMQGERLDLDACIRTAIDIERGGSPDPRHYQTRVLKNRDLSVFVLLDISESTRDRIGRTNRTIISVARTATALLAEAMAGLGDPFAICGFCSDGKDDVRFYRVKDFVESFDASALQRLAGLRGHLSTRLGAALRQAGAELSPQRTHRRLVLVISDGEPSDIDVADSDYLTEDARHAVRSLAHQGIDVLCIGLQSEDDAAMRRVFGRRGFVLIDRAEALAEKLPFIYLRMTT
ncbi:VWA domain-containing protein [Notoacmeibacter sp. MSK16QG-6]|uniref:nitric oxide reductase activation protein NorD n=1 Tax=Notoacmeibacter sp. MSK16QG-6 TaxID=2957982 RepID=UPI00209CA41A|nr:VWA domain-containing protein [Notoacmeibacter sp. MSK16QG-6]